MRGPCVEDLLDLQRPSGAFPSRVVHDGVTYDDENSFVTALVVGELGRWPRQGRVAVAIRCGLDFLEACSGRSRPGVYHFYPPTREPAWMGARLDADADDTSLVTLELVRHGRVPLERARRDLVDALEPLRVHHRPESLDAWVRPGAYRTWLDVRARPNPVDCVVNANVAATLKYLGLDDHPGYDAAWQTAHAALEWADGSKDRLRLVAPYYPDAREVLRALDRAVAVGVHELAATASRLVSHLAPQGAGPCADELPICSSACGRTWWSAPVLQALRRAERESTIPIVRGAPA